MPWTCSGCGVQGDRLRSTPAGDDKSNRICGRTGIAAIGGVSLCCICAKHSGWEGFLQYGCDACLRIGGVRPKPLRRAQQMRMDVTWSSASARSNRAARSAAAASFGFAAQWPLKVISEKLQEAARMVVFDFDNVLLRTPLKPKWWPYHGYENMIESLLNPLVPSELTDEWFDAGALERARECTRDPSTWTVLVTFRPKPFTERIRAILASVGVVFDEIKCRHICSCCNPLGFTHEHVGPGGYDRLSFAKEHAPAHPEDRHRLVTVGSILKDAPCVSSLEIWLPGDTEDLGTRAGVVARCLISTQRLRVDVMGVRTTPAAGGAPSAEYLAVLKEATLSLELSHGAYRHPSSAPAGRALAAARGSKGLRAPKNAGAHGAARDRDQRAVIGGADHARGRYYKNAASSVRDDTFYLYEKAVRQRPGPSWSYRPSSKPGMVGMRITRRMAGRAASALGLEDAEPWEPLSPGPEASPPASRPAGVVTLGDCWGAAAALIGGEAPGGPDGRQGEASPGVMSFDSDTEGGRSEAGDDDDIEAHAQDAALAEAFRAALVASDAREHPSAWHPGAPWEGCGLPGAGGAGRAASVASGYSMCGGDDEFDDDCASLVDGCPSEDWSVVSGGLSSRRPSLLEPPPRPASGRGGRPSRATRSSSSLGPPPPGGRLPRSPHFQCQVRGRGRWERQGAGQRGGCGRGAQPWLQAARHRRRWRCRGGP